MQEGLRDWWRQVCVTGLLFIGFALPGSDTPRVALWLAMLMAALTAILWVWPSGDAPARRSRRGLLRPAALWLLLVAALLMPWAASLLFKARPGAGGLLDPSAFTVEMLKFAAVSCAFLTGYRICQEDAAARRLIDALLAAGGLWATAAIILYILDPNGIYGVPKIAGAGRLCGAFGSANSAATLFGSLSVLAQSRILARMKMASPAPLIERIHPGYTAAFATCLAALCLTQSRAGIAVTILVLAVSSTIQLWRRMSVATAFVAIVGSLLLFTAFFSASFGAFAERLQSLGTDAQSRTLIYSTHLDAARHNPLYGTGLGSFNTRNNALVNAGNFASLHPVQSAHDVYLQWYEETGALGLAALCVLNLYILILIVLAVRRRPRMGERLTAIACAYLVFLLHGLSDYAFQEFTLALFTAVLLGSGYAVAGNTRRPEG